MGSATCTYWCPYSKNLDVVLSVIYCCARIYELNARFAFVSTMCASINTDISIKIEHSCHYCVPYPCQYVCIQICKYILGGISIVSPYIGDLIVII